MEGCFIDTVHAAVRHKRAGIGMAQHILQAVANARRQTEIDAAHKRLSLPVRCYGDSVQFGSDDPVRTRQHMTVSCCGDTWCIWIYQQPGGCMRDVYTRC